MKQYDYKPRTKIQSMINDMGIGETIHSTTQETKEV